MTKDEKIDNGIDFFFVILFVFAFTFLGTSKYRDYQDKYIPPRITIQDQNRSQIGTTLIQEGIVVIDPSASTQPSEVIITTTDKIWSFSVGPDTYK